MKLKNELEQLKYDLGVLHAEYCTNKENKEYRKLLQDNKPLPDGILRSDPDEPLEYASFYKIEKTSLSKDELSEYIQYKQLKSIVTIKNCVVFFTVLTAISLACGVIVALSLF